MDIPFYLNFTGILWAESTSDRWILSQGLVKQRVCCFLCWWHERLVEENTPLEKKNSQKKLFCTILLHHVIPPQKLSVLRSLFTRTGHSQKVGFSGVRLCLVSVISIVPIVANFIQIYRLANARFTQNRDQLRTDLRVENFWIFWTREQSLNFYCRSQASV